MATKFASIYRKELKSRGILSSIGSSVLKKTRERMDVRNALFGGSGVISATGQKIFGRGYSALSSGGVDAQSSAQVAAQAAATNELLSTSERQEALLRVVAKNTFNMNMMARDMNITRQNISSLTRAVTGKAARSQDALWYDAKARNQSIDSLGKKAKVAEAAAPTKTSGTSFLGSMGSVLGSIGSVLGSVLGTVGSGMLGVFRAVMMISPLLAIIGISASSYVIKELSKLDFGLGNIIDFEAVKNRMYEAIGYDPTSEKTFVEQMAKKLDDVFKTTKFSDSIKWIEKNFGPLADDIGESIAKITDITLVYMKSAFSALADTFINVGKLSGILIQDFFGGSNRKYIVGAIGAGLGAAFGGVPGAIFGGIVGAIGGALSSEPTVSELPGAIESAKTSIQQFQKDRSVSLQDALQARAKGGLFEMNLSPPQRELLRQYDRLVQLENRLEEYNDLVSGVNIPKNFSKYAGKYISELPGGRPGGGYVRRDAAAAADAALENRPTQIPSSDITKSLSGIRWKDLSEEQKNALLDRQAVQEGFTKAGTLPNRMNNPGAILLQHGSTVVPSGFRQFGAELGESNSAGILLKFPTAEQGRAAQRWLWENGKPTGTPGYANMTLLDAVKKWTGAKEESSEPFQNYIDNILKGIKSVPGVQISEMSSELSGNQRMAMAFDGSGITLVAPTTSVQAAAPARTSIPNPSNLDALELFARQSIGVLA